MDRFDLKQISKNAHIHFIGIGGISMSGLAMIALQNGYKVTGSDRSRSHITDKLSDMGAKIYEGHDEKNIDGADLCVHTAAVKMDNPEMAAAARKNIRLIDRAEFLGAIMKNYNHAVGVSGTHGKTTTTSMLAHALINADLDPTISVGGELDIIGGNIRTGGSEYFVTEACEYTNSFLKFYPTIALITNIEEDHLGFFTGGITQIRESFRQFAELTRNKGSVVALGSDKNIRIALEGSDLDITTYGMTDEYDYYPKNIVYRAGYPSFDVYKNGEMICHLNLNVPGDHNILNSLATIAVCELMGANIDKALLKFLEKADLLYIEAYQTRRFLVLREHFTRDAMEGINLKVLNEGESRYFAAKNYRNNDWEIVEDYEDLYVIRKTCIFKRIHVGLFKTMPASTDYEETGEVLKDGMHGYTVSSIGREVYI